MQVVDTVVEADEADSYPTIFFTSLHLPVIPPHLLHLATGVPIVMLQNINQPMFCSVMRLAVGKLMSNVVDATILKGTLKGEDILIHRVPIIPTDMKFHFSTLQFQIRLALAITINKTLG